MQTISDTPGSTFRIYVRPATLKDAAMMSQVHLSAWRAAYGSHLSTDYLASMDTAAWTHRWRARLASDEPDAAYLVATEAQRIVGIACAGPSRTSAWGAGGELRMLNVASDRWSRGIGNVLHSACLNHLAELGYQRAHLWVAETNDRAKSFYTTRQWTQGSDRKVDDRFDPSLTEVAYHRALDDPTARRAHPVERPADTAVEAD